MNIRLTVGNDTLTATLNSSQAARDFAAMLPLTLTLTDFHGTEKIADLPGRLATAGSPPGSAARAGDLAYYAPWGNLAIFYRDFAYSQGLVKLGALHGSVSVLSTQNPSFEVTIEVVERQGHEFVATP